MTDFFPTRMGHTFFEGAMPRLLEQLTRLNNLLERSIYLAERALEQVSRSDGDASGIRAIAGDGEP